MRYALVLALAFAASARAQVPAAAADDCPVLAEAMSRAPVFGPAGVVMARLEPGTRVCVERMQGPSALIRMSVGDPGRVTAVRLRLDAHVRERFEAAVAAREARTAPVPTYCSDLTALDDVSEDGDVLTTLDGRVWRVDGGYAVISSIWLPTSEAPVLADGRMVNLDTGELVYVSLLR